MSDFLLQSLVFLFRRSLQPIAPFTWFGLGVSSLDVIAAFRLCLALRQLREGLYAEYLANNPKAATKTHEFEEKSFTKDLSTTLTVVYGGEAMTCRSNYASYELGMLTNGIYMIDSLLGLTPSFMVSGIGVGLYATVQAFIEILPVVPAPSFALELPLSIVDGFTRAYLLCNLIPPVVTTQVSSTIAGSPWTLLLSSLVGNPSCSVSVLTRLFR